MRTTGLVIGCSLYQSSITPWRERADLFGWRSLGAYGILVVGIEASLPQKGGGVSEMRLALAPTPTPTPAPTPTPLGDFNLSVEALWKTGWPNALGAAAAICLPEGSHSCRLAGSESSLIDYALVSRKLHRILKLNLRGMGLDGKFD